MLCHTKQGDMGMITQKTIQAINEVAKVEDVVGEFVTLKRRGVNLIGLCPFHNEKTPSFIVSPGKNIYKCFGCGQAGNPVGFVMEHEAYSYPEALRYLAGRYGIEVEELESSKESEEERRQIDDLFALNQYAYDYFIQQMWDTDHGKSVGLSYFKKRGFREETLRKWGLGYAPDKRDDFTLSAIRDGYTQEQLRSVGLVNAYGRDFFRGRVMFPIRNLSGKVVAFGGRILAQDAKAAKYLNSPDSEVYHKSKVLFGAHFARQAIRKEDECIMVEGYTDTLAMHQAGIENVVAPCGTSLTEGQIQLIRRYTPHITFIFDGDAAGKKAALRGLDMVLEQDMNVKLVLLPEGEDPDSLLQQLGVTQFKEFVGRHKQDFILFKTEHLLGEAAGDPIRKAQLIKEVIGSIAKIPDPVKRSVYIKECATLTGTSEDIFFSETNKLIAKKLEERQAQKKKDGLPPPSTPAHPTAGGDHGFVPDFPPMPNMPSHELDGVFDDEAPIPWMQDDGIAIVPTEYKKQGDEFQEQDIVRLLMEAGRVTMEMEGDPISVSEFILGNIAELLDDFDNATYAAIIGECLEQFNQGDIPEANHFMNHPDEQVRSLSFSLLTSVFEYSPNWDDKLDLPMQTQPLPELNFTQDTVQAVNRFKLRKVKGLLKTNQLKLRDTQDPEEQMRILRVQQKLTQLKMELAAYFGTVIL